MKMADWTITEDADDAALAVKRLEALVGQIRQFQTLLEDGATPTHRGSAFAGDDRAASPIRVSERAWTPLATAIDHLVLVAECLQHLPSMNPIAFYTLLRPSIESAAWCLWILSPTARIERVARTLQYVHLDEADGWKVSAARDVDSSDQRIALRAELERIAARSPGIDPRRIFVHVGSAHVIREVNPLVDSGRHDGVLWWTMLSGLSHGRPHGLLALLQREQLRQFPGGVRQLELRASLVAMAVGVEIGVRYVDAALGLWARRNTSPTDPLPSGFSF